MKQHVFEDVKKEFYKYGGMSGDSTAETDAYYDKIHSYVKTLKASDRSPATWTLSQLHLDLAHAVTAAVKEKVPGWTNGKPIPSDVLDEIFADEGIIFPICSACYPHAFYAIRIFPAPGEQVCYCFFISLAYIPLFPCKRKTFI